MLPLNEWKWLFDRIWEQYADEGRADSLGGAEYNRIWTMWVNSKEHIRPRVFILDELRRSASPQPQIADI